MPASCKDAASRRAESAPRVERRSQMAWSGGRTRRSAEQYSEGCDQRTMRISSGMYTCDPRRTGLSTTHILQSNVLATDRQKREAGDVYPNRRGQHVQMIPSYQHAEVIKQVSLETCNRAHSAGSRVDTDAHTRPSWILRWLFASSCTDLQLLPSTAEKGYSTPCFETVRGC